MISKKRIPLLFIIMLQAVPMKAMYQELLAKGSGIIKSPKVIGLISTGLAAGTIYAGYLIKNHYRLQSLMYSESPLKFYALAESYLNRSLPNYRTVEQVKHDTKTYNAIRTRLHSLWIRSMPEFYETQADIIKETFSKLNLTASNAQQIYDRLELPRRPFSATMKRLEVLLEQHTGDKTDQGWLVRQTRYTLDNPFEQQNFDAVCAGQAEAANLKTQTFSSSLTAEKILAMQDTTRQRLLDLSDREDELLQHQDTGIISWAKSLVGY